ncbi:hypothetical protein T4D_12979 [Trichinella pseudospiralis]|uniref:Uncharacterized protein n=1 Tax=Trichinella pseudospiralis TaxID=6337 RepID=A0A0V1FJ41_TRIPS|nr:hypothetical protein T4D_12979 [Trichinella pseudospiralis]
MIKFATLNDTRRETDLYATLSLYHMCALSCYLPSAFYAHFQRLLQQYTNQNELAQQIFCLIQSIVAYILPNAGTKFLRLFLLVDKTIISLGVYGIIRLLMKFYNS